MIQFEAGVNQDLSGGSDVDQLLFGDLEMYVGEKVAEQINSPVQVDNASTGDDVQQTSEGIVYPEMMEALLNSLGDTDIFEKRELRAE